MQSGDRHSRRVPQRRQSELSRCLLGLLLWREELAGFSQFLLLRLRIVKGASVRGCEKVRETTHPLLLLPTSLLLCSCCLLLLETTFLILDTSASDSSALELPQDERTATHCLCSASSLACSSAAAFCASINAYGTAHNQLSRLPSIHPSKRTLSAAI